MRRERRKEKKKKKKKIVDRLGRYQLLDTPNINIVLLVSYLYSTYVDDASITVYN